LIEAVREAGIEIRLEGHGSSTQSDFIMMSEEAFAPRLGEYELLLLRKAIKYSGLMGKEVRVIPSRPLAF
jgi:hypothetical protein